MNCKRLLIVEDDESIRQMMTDRKSTRLNSSHLVISYAVFCLKKKKEEKVGFEARGTIPSARRSESRQPHSRSHPDAPYAHRHHRRRPHRGRQPAPSHDVGDRPGHRQGRAAREHRQPLQIAPHRRFQRYQSEGRKVARVSRFWILGFCRGGPRPARSFFCAGRFPKRSQSLEFLNHASRKPCAKLPSSAPPSVTTCLSPIGKRAPGSRRKSFPSARFPFLPR